MAERSQHRASEGLEGRSECPATGVGSPEPNANREGTQVENLCYEETKVENLCYGSSASQPVLASRRRAAMPRSSVRSFTV